MRIYKILQLALNSSKLTEISSDNYMSYLRRREMQFYRSDCILLRYEETRTFKEIGKIYYLSCIQSNGLFYMMVNYFIFFFLNVKVNNRISGTLWRRYGHDDVHLRPLHPWGNHNFLCCGQVCFSCVFCPGWCIRKKASSCIRGSSAKVRLSHKKYSNGRLGWVWAPQSVTDLQYCFSPTSLSIFYLMQQKLSLERPVLSGDEGPVSAHCSLQRSGESASRQR